MQLLMGRTVTKRRILGHSVVSVSSDGRQWTLTGAGDGSDGSGGSGGAPAGDHYTHSVWGLTSKLTPARPLQGNYLRVTDIDRGKNAGSDPNGLLWEDVGTDGQRVRGGWLTATLGQGTSLVPGGRVYCVVIDGNGADVWIDGNRSPGGSPRPDINYHIHCQNVRTLRLTGLKVFIDDARKVAGAWPDSGAAANFNWHGMNTGLTVDPSAAGGFEEVIVFRWMNNDSFVLVEGCDIDLNEGGVVQSKRTDATASNNWGTSANGTATSALVFQNTRIVNVSSDLADSHADVHHFQSDHYLRWLHTENFEATSKYQGFQINYERFLPAGAINTRLHCRHYRCRMAANGSSAPLFTLGTPDELTSNIEHLMPSIEFESSWLAKSGAPFWPNTISNNAQNPVMDADYHTARSNIARLMDYGDGAVQANMSNADGARVLQGLYFSQNDSGNLPVVAGSVVPPSAVGHNYATLWDAAGNLLAED